MIFSGS